MKFELNPAMEVLNCTPAVLQSLLGGLSEPWIMNCYGEQTFSPFDVVGHLIHGERTDWMVRVRHILQHGESPAFEPFDRYAMFTASAGQSIADLLSTFAGLRRKNLQDLTALNLSDEQLQLRGTHPELGVVTLEALLATWVAHDLNHLGQIAKAMAWQYRDAVGPWAPYISVLPKG